MRFDRVEGLQRVGVGEQRDARLRTEPLAKRDFVFGPPMTMRDGPMSVLIGKDGATDTPRVPQAN